MPAEPTPSTKPAGATTPTEAAPTMPVPPVTPILSPSMSANAPMPTEHASGETGERELVMERLRRLGVRVTPQRLFVVEALERGGGHMTAEEIMQWAAQRYPALNLATVYRTLDMLVDVGLVTQTGLGGGATSFELVGDSPHHHLVCEHCGAVMEMDEATLTPLRDRLLATYGFVAHPRHLAIFGLCHQCATLTTA
ncbi:MAG: Fur family transcriptional regulator [Ktedonobacterales bacterium]